MNANGSEYFSVLVIATLKKAGCSQDSFWFEQKRIVTKTKLFDKALNSQLHRTLAMACEHVMSGVSMICTTKEVERGLCTNVMRELLFAKQA